MGLNSNFVTSTVAPQERWLKLYRKIHNLFLKNEFIHTIDYNKTISLLNSRISELETKLNTELTKIGSGLATHVHPAPQAPTGTIPTLPPIIPPYINSLTPTTPATVDTTAMDNTDRMYQGMGPAFAPIGDGIGVEASLASTTSQSQVGA